MQDENPAKHYHERAFFIDLIVIKNYHNQQYTRQAYGF